VPFRALLLTSEPRPSTPSPLLEEKPLFSVRVAPLAILASSTVKLVGSGKALASVVLALKFTSSAFVPRRHRSCR
jgi:hypothetical protein